MRHQSAVKKVLCSLVVSVLALGILLMTFVQNDNADGSTGVSTKIASQADHDKSWRTTDAPTAPDGADRKPMLYQMLGRNNKIDTQNDELRLDFVVRVAHGEVNPHIGNGSDWGGTGGDDATISKLGLRITYDWGTGNDRTGTDNIRRHMEHYVGHDLSYLNTIDTNSSSIANNPGETWANNQDQFFTIPKIIESGEYDYVVISMETDLDIPNEDTGPYNPSSPDSTSWNAATNAGRKFGQNVYVAVGAEANAAKYPMLSRGDSPDTADADNTTGDMLDGKVTDVNIVDPHNYKNEKKWHLSTNVTANEEWTSYPNYCLATNSSHPDPYAHGCAVPLSQVGYDQVPILWSRHQSNWGLQLDQPLVLPNPLDTNLDQRIKDAGLDKTYKSGVAPPDSFFVQWYNAAVNDDIITQNKSYNPCFKQTKFKYQWFGLQNGKDWVPVTALTASPEKRENQPISWSGQPPHGANNSGGISLNITPRSAFNAKVDLDNDLGGIEATGERNLISSSSNIAKYMQKSAQNPDGSIDFGLAQREQENPEINGQVGDANYRGLDGYFKLVTWPVTPDGCDVSIWNSGQTDNTYNPADPVDPGVDARNMTATQLLDPDEQKAIAKTIDSGWTIDTAFYNFDVNRPETPTIDSVTINDQGSTNFKQIPESEEADYALADTYAQMKFSSSASPVIHGTGTPGDVISLYGDKAKGSASDEIDKQHPQETETEGCLIGTTTVDKNGNWQITDAEAYTSIDLATRRYHAYQTEPSGMQLSSDFSTIAMLRLITMDDQPSITSVKVPVTQKGVLPTGSKITVNGTAASQSGDSTLTLYVVHAHTPTGTENGMEDGTTARRKICSVPITGTTSQSWSCTDTGGKTGLNWYTKRTSEDPYFNFIAVMQTAQIGDHTGAHSPEATTTKRVNLRAPSPGMTSVSKKDGATGTVKYAVPGAAPVTTVSLTWHVKSKPETTTTTTATVKDDDTWKASVPDAIIKGGVGDVTATVTDADGNESASQVLNFNFIPPVTRLPLTGSRPQALILALVGLATLALIVAIVLCWQKSRRRHY